jgi:hypothetical protein
MFLGAKVLIVIALAGWLAGSATLLNRSQNGLQTQTSLSRAITAIELMMVHASLMMFSAL